MALYKHAYLRNDQDGNEGFRKTRNVAPKEEDQDDEERPKILTDRQKERLRNDNLIFYKQRRRRKDIKTLGVPGEIDLIRIHFFTTFNADLRKKFFANYGLNIVEATNFNRSVLFEIEDERLFVNFSGHMEQAYDSPEGSSYEGKAYALMALIYRFEFITTHRRLNTFSQGGVVLNLVTSASRKVIQQKEFLLNYLQQQELDVIYSELYPDIIEVKKMDEDSVRLIARNFDVVKMITSARVAKLRPGVYGETVREYGFTVNVPENIQTVGIIDTGVGAIPPLRSLLTTINYDHTGKGANWDESGHGTMVAGIVCLGDRFQMSNEDSYNAHARIAVIKAIHNDNDEINIPQLLTDIRDAARNHGVRLFNMSLNIPATKRYNDSYSFFAYELDKLAYEEGILILMSVGNTDEGELERLLTIDIHASHNYPAFFYDLDSTSDHHSCWFTNIQEPSESLNNISIGALAGNLEDLGNTDATPEKNFPAYYSRKFHLDYTLQVNGADLKKNQNNNFLNKPDLVFEGGDYFSAAAKMEVLRSPMDDTERFFGRSAGTSLATPMITSYAAQLLNVYPGISVQTAKALLINSAQSPCAKDTPAFAGFGIPLLKRLTGFGKPVFDQLLYSDENSAVLVVEDTIGLDEMKVIPLNIPRHIAAAGNKLQVSITLCYAFLPVKYNHLSYLPLHISFGLFKSYNADTIANAKADVYKIKSNISWSEDFFGVENRLFSNVQKKEFNLQARDIDVERGLFNIAIRSTGKKNIPESHRRHLEEAQHPFSLVISLTEIPEARASGQLQTELHNINMLEVIGEADLEASVSMGK